MPVYNLIEYSSNYSETTGCSWFYSKYEATNCNTDIANNNNFKSFEYKATLLVNTVAQPANAANGILKKTIIAIPLKYSSNFWRSLERPLINWKVELKMKWTKYCVLSAAGNDNNNDRNDKIIFTIKDIKLFVPLPTLSAIDNQKFSKLLGKGFERSVYWNDNKTQSENKTKTWI